MPNLWNRLTARKPPAEPPQPALDSEEHAPPAGGESAAPSIPRPEGTVAPLAPDITPTPSTATPDEDQNPEDTGATQAGGGWHRRLAGSGFARGLSTLFARNPVLSDELLDELEVALLSADVGVATTSDLMDDLRRRTLKREFTDAAALREALRTYLVEQLAPVARPLDTTAHRPFVVLVVGVNGVGKTTTIGKLARLWIGDHRTVLLAAGDTFRAAAVAQLEEWGRRLGVFVCAQGQGADAASVVFDALQTATARRTDLLIADTAGRLHTRSGLMDELAKVKRVLGKLDPGAPHEVLMVIDGTTGQNAISQVRQFADRIGVTGLVVTKLDGTAKGGVMLALAREFALPIRFVGLGERAEDLREFDARAFVDGLLPAPA